MPPTGQAISFPGSTQPQLGGYLARPDGDGPFPGLVVIHEAFGLNDDMRGIVERYIAAQRKAIVAAVENWWDKYRVTLTQLEGRRDEAAHALRHYLNELRYV